MWWWRFSTRWLKVSSLLKSSQTFKINFCLHFILVGFKNVAIEQIHKHESISTKGGDSIPEPIKLDKLLEKTNKKLNLFNRLTVVYSDPSVTHTLGRSHNLKKFHIVAALPTTEAALQHACQTFIGDIITYNIDTVRIRLNRKFYYCAVRRNLFFELKYSPIILDSTVRKATIARAHQYHMVGKSKAIIISSEAKDRFQVRNPFSIACLGLLFGISEEQAKCAISTMSRKVFIAAESRRLGRAPVIVKYEDVDTSTSEEDDDDDEAMLVDSSQDSKKRKNDVKPSAPNKKLKTL